MFSRWRDRARAALAYRLAVWYAGIFLASSVLVILVAYGLLTVSLQGRDRDVIAARLGEYASAYQAGGIDGVSRVLTTEQLAGDQESLFIRILGPFRNALLVRMPASWGAFDTRDLDLSSRDGAPVWAYAVSPGRTARLEVAQMRLRDGTVLQVGKSTEVRDQLLTRFRRVLFLVLATCAAVGLAGGAVLTRSALRPVRHLAAIVNEIIHTGRIDTRVPSRGNGDPLDDLGRLFNTMLDRMQRLVAGMRGALDNVAHDLRTPLTRLRVSAEQALERGGSADALREALSDCLEESGQALTMLTTLMDISEAETGTMRLRLEPCVLTPLLRAVSEMYGDLADDKGVSLVTDCPQSLVVEADEQRLRQVLANLLDNAVKYTPRGGRVAIAAAPAADGRVDISVRDTGVGIPAADQPRIWERLYRGDQSRSERGLGLGLSLVRAVVAAHGGQVAVESRPGGGATFTVSLPVGPR